MAEFIAPREPGPVAIKKGVEALIDGMNARADGVRWFMASPPDCLERTTSVGAGKVDAAGIIRPNG